MADTTPPVMRRSAGQRLRGIFLGARREFSPDEKHHESNLAWGPIAIGCSIVLTVVAAMKHDLRFLFFVAWPCFAFGAWRLSKRIPYKALAYWIAGISCVAVACALCGLNIWLAPPVKSGTSGPKSKLDVAIHLDSWGTIPPETAYGVIDGTKLFPYRDQYKLMLAVRGADYGVDPLDDPNIIKSQLFTASDHPFEVDIAMDQEFLHHLALINPNFARIQFWMCVVPPNLQVVPRTFREITSLGGNCNMGGETSIAHPFKVVPDQPKAEPASRTSQVPAQPPTYQQNCEGSACAQGPGSQATLNQYGAPKLAMLDWQRDLVRDDMKSFANSEVEILCPDQTDDSLKYAQQLAKSLRDAGMNIEGPDAATIFRSGSAVPSGVSVYSGRDRIDIANALAGALHHANLVSSPVEVAIDEHHPDKFEIIVAPNR